MDKYIPELDLAKLHKEQLGATKFQVVDKCAEEYPDNDARLKALDLGYKLHGKYAPEKSAHVNVNINQESEQDPEKLRAIVQKVITEMKEDER
jgi:hypothetical protein